MLTWRRRGRGEKIAVVLCSLVAIVALMPLISITVIALRGDWTVWPHLVRTVLIDSTRVTGLLMLGVGLTTAVIGLATAWLVTMHDFPGRRLFDWMLLLPLAVPTYVAAYTYVEILDYLGPVQSMIRSLFGFTSSRDYWFPEIRSLGGAIALMSLVLYPYVYLAARASFLMQSASVLDVSRALGRGPVATFWHVALPLARPSAVVGVTLALMECLNDIGAMQFLGVRTLTVSVYATWTNRANLGGAAQIACAMLLVVFVLLVIERHGRRAQRFHDHGTRARPARILPLRGGKAALAALACALPVFLGFVAPALYLADAAIAELPRTNLTAYADFARNSFVLSVIAAFVAVVTAVTVTYAVRLTGSGTVRLAGRLAGIGYAVPGTVLAVGILVPLAAFDNAVDGAMRTTFGIATGLLLTGSGAALVYAYTTRFFAVSHGAIEAGLGRISPHLDMAARSLGRTPLATLREVHLPLMRPALATAGLLVFVDSMKELPATLLLRPFNFETLATTVYSYASMEMVDKGALGALVIVGVGVVPVILLARTSRTTRQVTAEGLAPAP
ncbi:ABC transporter permease [Lutibaculum baratangense]|uniref:Ferric iron ABC transporter, permease protein n=1 Tax=Lutibaculum baratangense AMV1 TaxID=631454 RepID=V4QVA2_9HYPH|nr:iron ABC transporter permease [Lutibaculum baratangense]ESR23697.1 Ferric iron ABC transporter, permease protein [Lutibaculum baratangense AMV1]